MIPAFGSHMVLGALPAAAVGRALGLTGDEITRGLSRYKTVGGRANVIETGKLRIINDCYNANPNSMRASIRSLGELSGRKVAILGDMKELGENAEALHFAIGTDTLAEGVDIVVCTGELSKEICRGNGNCAVWFPTVEDIIGALPDFILPGDTVLVKASHSMGYSAIVEALRKLEL